ncbi:MAG: DNA-binding protein [Cryobacterium sp.]|nr:DNA-binding protein [Cryobacterium sp.]
MFVITADQIDSRSGTDLVSDAVRMINSGEVRPVLYADRTVGDELQVLVESGADALLLLLHLTRAGRWSVGCGAGEIADPLPLDIREAAGPAFIAARRAVERAKKKASHFALESEPRSQSAEDAEALIDLLLTLRSRRSAEGWELFDLLATGLSQVEAADRLGISPQAVSLRARAAELRIEDAAREPLARMLELVGSLEPKRKGVRS